MKVLYIGSERNDAQAVANALRSVDESVSVLWASQLENAANWLGERRDLDALVMEAPIDGASCLVVQKQLRRLALPPAVVFLVPDGIAPSLDSLYPGGHYVRRNEALARDLPVVVTRAIESAARLDLEQQLARATTAREEAEQRQQTAADQLAALQTQYEVGMARAEAAWDMVDEQLRTAALEVERSRQREQSVASEVARLSQRESDLSSQLADAAAAHSTLVRQLADANSAVDAAHAQTQHERAAAATQLRDRERDFQAQVDRALEQRHTLEAQLAQANDARHAVDAQLAQAVDEREGAEQRHAAAMLDVARLTARETELNGLLTNITASRTELEQRLAATQAAFDDAAARATRDRLAASKKAAEREAELDGQIHRERADRASLEQTLTAVNGALEHARREHQATIANLERMAAREAGIAAQLSEVQARREALEHSVAQGVAERDDLLTRLNDTATALGQAQRAHASASSDVERLTRRETELACQIADVRATFEQRLADINSALDQARRDHQATTADLQTATVDLERMTAREAEVAAQLAKVHARREALEVTVAKGVAERDDLLTRLNDTTTALDQARRDHQATATDLQAATADLQAATAREADVAAQLAKVHARRDALEVTVAKGVAERDDLLKRLNDTTTALDQTRRAHASASTDVERLTRRETELASQLADVRATLEQQLAGVNDALEQSRRDHEVTIADLQAAKVDLERTTADLQAATADLQAATADLQAAMAREADLASQLVDVQAQREALEQTVAETAETLRQERDTRAALERRITDTDAALAEARREYQDARAEIEQLSEREARLSSHLAETETALARVREDYQSASADVERLTQCEAELASQLVEAQAARHTLERELSDAGTTIREAAARETELDEQLQHERTVRAELEQAVADGHTALRNAREQHAAVQQDFKAASAEIDRLTGVEAGLALQLTDAQAIRATLEQTLTDARARFVTQRQQLEIQLAQEQLEHESQSAEMHERTRALTDERDALQQSLATQQDRARQLQNSLASSVEAFEVSRAESHRLFDHSGVAMFRCTREGVLTDVNRACTTLIGRRTYELASTDFATAVFEAPQALSWLIERCISTRTKESIETTWRRQDGSRLFMRLSARSLPSDIIEVVAEDLTRLRVLEERLSQAQRMEALGRLASEVAITCGGLLASIQEQGRQWVSQFPTHSDARQRGEELLDDVGRAAGFLGELAACGEEQTRTPMLVDLNTLVRDLEPVLKNVVGGEVEVALRDTSTPLNVDVNTERIERLLVNLASYGRGRMPAGGRLRIELGTSVVDRHFSAKHPNVRLGLHALITVTESRRPGRDEDAPSQQRKRKSAGPGVDFATLQSLVSDCGGHLWMKVHPLGEMVAKIRLPLFRSQDQQRPQRATMMARAKGERQNARWFQS